MTKSFGEELLHFAQSVDYLTEDNLRRIREMVFEYLKSKAGAATIEVCVQKLFRGAVGLDYIWYSERTPPQAHQTRRQDDGAYFGQTSYAFETKKRLWIVAKSDVPLDGASEYVDLWSQDNEGSRHIPPFDPYTGNKRIKTSIILPLTKSDSDQCWGVLNIEFEDRLELYARLEKEIVSIRDAIEILIELEAASRLSRENTSKAIARMDAIAKSVSRLRMPSVFVAHPLEHDKEVSSAIATVLGEFFANDQIVFWNSVSETGNISIELVKIINSATYGVCYFSEKRDQHYVDNANVLFEAGMLHALTNNPLTHPVKWIPIREKADKIPFDFAQERILVIPRDLKGSFSSEVFMNSLRKMLRRMVGQDPI